jgi:NADH-quinone oxidoreductase subunit C
VVADTDGAEGAEEGTGGSGGGFVENDAVENDAVEAAEPVEPVDTEYGVPVSRPRGELVLHPTREQLRDVVRAMRADGYVMCVDVCGVDYLTHPARVLPGAIPPERFEVVVSLLDLATPRRARLRVQVPADDPTCPSLFPIHPGVEALEREVYDMFGITFDGHPDMTRILMPEEWIGHPLRKDYAIGKIPVQFKGAPS